MKIYYSIIIGFILICCLSFTTKYLASTWAGTASNQALTYDVLNDIVKNNIFPTNLAADFYTGGRLATCSLFAKHVLINTEYPAFNAKSENQIVVKSDISPYTYSALMGISTASGGWTNCIDARNETGPYMFNTVYYNTGWVVGTHFRINTGSLDVTKYYCLVGQALGFSVKLIDSRYNVYEVTSVCFL